MRVGRIALGPGHGAPLPVPGYLQRVDRVHPVAGGEQRLHPRTPVGLDADHHLHPIDVLVTDVPADQGMQPVDAGDPLGELGLAQHPAVFILYLDVVVLLGPVVAD